MYDVCDVILTFANQRFGKVCWHNVHIQGHRSSGREAVPSPRRAFCGLAPPKKAPRPQNWIMKHYKSVEFNQISEYQAPWTDVEPPIENFLAMVLLGRGAVKQLRTMETYKKIVTSCVCSVHQQCWPQKYLEIIEKHSEFSGCPNSCNKFVSSRSW